jgi:cytidine deaminase
MITRQIFTTLIEFESESELEPTDKELVKQAREATKKSYSPYSKFSVGAAILLENGQIIQGNNQENAAYPSGLCAERVALFYANANFPESKVLAIAIAANSGKSFTNLPVTPCGSCRQVIIETQNRFKYPIKIILYGKDKILLIEDASTLLPISFSDEFLKKV